MSANLAANLIATAERYGDRPALRLDNEVMNYAAFSSWSALVAGLIRDRGIRHGDRVGIMVPNVPYFPLIYYGILRAGAIVVPMNVLLKEREIGFYLEDSGAKAVFVWHNFADAATAGAQQVGTEVIIVQPGRLEQELNAATPVTQASPCAGDDTAVILYTSGTTGKPKGAELTHDNLRKNVDVVRGLFDLGPEDVILGALPLFHSFGQTCGMNAAVSAGSCLTLLPRFDPKEALEIMRRDCVTVFEGVPTMYGALLHSPGRDSADLSALRLCASGGASLPVELMRGFEREFGCVILEGYGLSETSPVASFHHRDRERKPGSIGMPVAGVIMKVFDDDDREVPVGEVGEIVIRGHNVMKQYWRRPEATADCMRNGWFHTGDMAKVDDDGYFFIVDRKKDLIIRGGYNIYPREVEETLYEHPAIREAAVVGLPHDELGEEVGAAVVLLDGQQVSGDELKAYVKERIAAYKYPRFIWFVDELPKGPTGKILKREIALPTEVGGPME